MDYQLQTFRKLEYQKCDLKDTISIVNDLIVRLNTCKCTANVATTHKYAELTSSRSAGRTRSSNLILFCCISPESNTESQLQDHNATSVPTNYGSRRSELRQDIIARLNTRKHYSFLSRSNLRRL